MALTAYDSALRARLKKAVRVNQRALASAAGRRQGWLSKLLKGKGNASIDEFIALASYFPDWNGSLEAFLAKLAPDDSLPAPINPKDIVQTDLERQALRAFRRTKAEQRLKLLNMIEVYVRETRQRGPSQEEPRSETQQATKHRSPGKGQAAGSRVSSIPPERPAQR